MSIPLVLGIIGILGIGYMALYFMVKYWEYLKENGKEEGG